MSFQGCQLDTDASLLGSHPVLTAALTQSPAMSRLGERLAGWVPRCRCLLLQLEVGFFLGASLSLGALNKEGMVVVAPGASLVLVPRTSRG